SAPAPAPVRYQDCWDGSSVPVTAECPPQIVEDQFAVAEPINFTVYFDYDKSNLTPEASNLVREAASRALQNDIDTVVVAGNTDTSGSSAYNQMLSERRAAVVRDALIANGVSADRIRTEAYGETNLAKPTPDGTREPLNRRSEVTISFE
ncbi:MAG: OmpA family protein, partial [Pseudomonadota bacterium]